MPEILRPPASVVSEAGKRMARSKTAGVPCPIRIKPTSRLEYFDRSVAAFSRKLNRYPAPERCGSGPTRARSGMPALWWFEFEIEGGPAASRLSHGEAGSGGPRFSSLRDATSGKETYAAEIFDLPEIPAASYAGFNRATTVLRLWKDFSCRSRPENALPVAVRAGKDYRVSSRKTRAE